MRPQRPAGGHHVVCVCQSLGGSPKTDNGDCCAIVEVAVYDSVRSVGREWGLLVRCGWNHSSDGSRNGLIKQHSSSSNRDSLIQDIHTLLHEQGDWQHIVDLADLPAAH